MNTVEGKTHYLELYRYCGVCSSAIKKKMAIITIITFKIQYRNKAAPGAGGECRTSKSRDRHHFDPLP